MTSVPSDEEQQLLEKEKTLSDAQKQKRSELRHQVMQELLSTERSYVESLEALSRCFVQPLQVKSNTYKPFQDISHTHVEYMCSNIQTLLNFHHSFIQALSQVPLTNESSPPNAEPSAGASANNPTTSIPAIFLRFSSFFKLYIPFLNNYQHALDAFNALRNHKKFQEFLNGEVKTAFKAHAAKCGTGDLDLLSYMIQPVQRVPRYLLLLKELKRQTSPLHPEYESLVQSIVQVHHVASVINEGQRAVENANKLMLIQNKLIATPDNFPSLIQPHRRLIKEGNVTATYSHGMFSTVRTRRSVFFLFTDILLWTNETFKYKGSFDLTPAKLSAKSSTCFLIDSRTQVLQAAFDSEEETKKWFEAIEEVVCNLQSEREKLRSRVIKARNMGSTADKDAVHLLVTQGLQELQLRESANNEASSTVSESSQTHNSRASYGGSLNGNSSMRSAGGTIGKTLGQRNGRSWEETLEAGEAKLRREQEHLAAFSREKLAADTFSAPQEEKQEANGGDYDAFASSSSSPPAIPQGSPPEKKFVPRFVARRGKGTLAKNGCLCTTILVHVACPLHGDNATASEQLLEAPADVN